MRRICLLIVLCLTCFNAIYGYQSQTIRGVVLEQNTGQPIAYATIILSNLELQKSTVSDSIGNFQFLDVPIGRYDMEVRCIGYEPCVEKELAIDASKEVIREIRLQESLLTLNELVVKPKVNKAGTINTMSITGGRMLSVEEASRYAGGMDDPARLVASFAGVASTVGNNGIVVRGNAPKSLQWRVEDVEIPNPNHFADVTSFGGGGLTALSSNVLGNSDFFTGAFTAEYNNAISGVFDMHFRRGNNLNHEHALQIGSLGIDAASEGPLKKGYNGSYLFNYRYSTLSLLSPLLPEDADGTDYQDVSFNFFLPTSQYGTFSIWGIGLIDRSGTTAEDNKDKWVYEQDKQNQDVKQFMGAMGVSHKKSIGKASSLQSTAAMTVSGLDLYTEMMNEQMLPVPENKIKNTNWNFVFSSALQTRYNEHHTNKTGIRVTGMSYNMLLQENKSSDALETIVDENGYSNLLSAYTLSMLRFNDKWSANVGVNCQLFTLNGNYTVEPRLSVKYKVSPAYSLSLGYGLHSRLEMLNYYFVRKGTELVNKDLDFTKAHHLSLCNEIRIDDERLLRIEPYFQYLYDVPVVSGSTFSLLNLNGGDDWFITEPLSNEGEGINYGLDVTYEKYMRGGYYYMFTASLLGSFYRTTTGGSWYNTRYNRNFVLNVLVGKEWLTGKSHQNVWSVNGRITLQGGDRYSPINEAESERVKDVVYDENSKPYSKQLSPVLLGHITVSYKMNKKGKTHEFAAKLMNVFGYRDYYGHRYNFKENCVEAEREANIVPSISYKIAF